MNEADYYAMKGKIVTLSITGRVVDLEKEGGRECWHEPAELFLVVRCDDGETRRVSCCDGLWKIEPLEETG